MKLVEEKENPGSRLLRQGESLKHRLGEYLSRLAGNLGEIRASLLWWMGRIPLLRRLLDQKVRRRLGGILLVCSPLLLTF